MPNENTSDNSVNDVLRWAAMPVAAILGSVIGSILIVTIYWFSMKFQGGYSEDGWFYLYVIPVIASVAFGGLWVWISMSVAPRGKFVAGIVMTTILCLPLLALTVLVWALGRSTVSESIQSTVGCIAAIISAIVTLVSNKDMV